MAISDFKRGDTKRYKFSFTQNTGTQEVPVYTPVDITNWAIFFTLKVNQDDADTIAAAQVKAVAGGYAFDDPANGIMYLVMGSDVSDAIEPGKYYYDFQRVIPGTPPDVKTLDSDVVSVEVDNTRATE